MDARLTERRNTEIQRPKGISSQRIVFRSTRWRMFGYMKIAAVVMVEVIDDDAAMRRNSRESWKDCGHVVKNTGHQLQSWWVIGISSKEWVIFFRCMGCGSNEWWWGKSSRGSKPQKRGCDAQLLYLLQSIYHMIFINQWPFAIYHWPLTIDHLPYDSTISIHLIFEFLSSL